MSYECRNIPESHKQYFPPAVETIDYNVVIDGRNFFNQPVKKIRTYNIRKVATGQGDDYTTGCFLGYRSFKEYDKLTVKICINSKN